MHARRQTAIATQAPYFVSVSGFGRSLQNRESVRGLDALSSISKTTLPDGPIFANSLGNPLSLGSVVNRVILPALNRCQACGKAESNHQGAGLPYERDNGMPE